jgi:hypothetical protein
MALWVEALENRQFSLDTRSTIIRTLLFFFCIQESLMNLTTVRGKAESTKSMGHFCDARKIASVCMYLHGSAYRFAKREFHS